MSLVISPRFGESVAPVSQTKRLSIYPDQSDPEAINTIGWSQIPDIFSNVIDLFHECARSETSDSAQPEKTAAGMRIELGGRENYTASTIRAENSNWFKTAVSAFKETAVIFLKKIGLLLRAGELRKLWNGLSFGKNATAETVSEN